jgi:hypothetical protein
MRTQLNQRMVEVKDDILDAHAISDEVSKRLLKNPPFTF